MTKDARFAGLLPGLLAAVLLVQTGCVRAQTPVEPLPDGVDPATGYRMERYRAPVPDTLTGGRVLDTAQVRDKLATDIVLIDVYPPKGLGPDPLDGEWLTTEKHQNIDGSIWLPEVGRGFLTEDFAAYFRRNLTQLTNDSRENPILFYCTADCWQSWNAARRAIVWGYSQVFWYPEGIDGWLDAGFGLVPATPVNFLGE